MKLIFIRHGKTNGNAQHRYVGRTDEDLCDEGRELAKEKTEYYKYFEEADAVFVSPMKRCIQTMQIYYNNDLAIPVHCIDKFREYDFGEYEMKNHEELMKVESYRKWLECNGEYDMPCGEGVDKFKKRVIDAFEESIKICRENKYENVIYVVHGGVIMSIFEKYDEKQMSYYDYKINNLECYVTEYNFDKIRRM